MEFSEKDPFSKRPLFRTRFHKLLKLHCGTAVRLEAWQNVKFPAPNSTFCQVSGPQCWVSRLTTILTIWDTFFIFLRKRNKFVCQMLLKATRVLNNARRSSLRKIDKEGLDCWKPLSLNFCQTICTRSENASEPPLNHIRTTSEPHPKQWQNQGETNSVF